VRARVSCDRRWCRIAKGRTGSVVNGNLETGARLERPGGGYVVFLLWAVGGALALAALAAVFWDGLAYMVSEWDAEEYSHAPVIPIIAALLIWRRRAAVTAALQAAPPAGRWAGVALVAFGVALGYLGELSTIFVVIQVGFLVAVFGIALALLGWRGLKPIVAPLVYLAFMVPLPDFFEVKLSAELQLVSSWIGVEVIRLFGIAVYLEGNVIDLGVFRLQVVEACSGLRYLFPLMSFGFLCAFLYRGAFWQRAVLFLSTIPITILMNSLRIGLIGVFVEYWGIEQAEGVLHYFEGWVIFVSCVLILFAETALFARLGGGGRAFADMFDLDFRLGGGGVALPRRLVGAWIAGFAILVLGAAGSIGLSNRVDATPARQPLAAIPMTVDRWAGQPRAIERDVLAALRLTDYLFADFVLPGSAAPVNFYIAYYASQRKGVAIHSPRTCIPGGGWSISRLEHLAVPGVKASGGGLLHVNRAVITKEEDRQLVYYWFEQRGRNLTNEYLVKWYIFWDGLTRSRTDGALVRLVTPIVRGESEAIAERRLQRLLRDLYPKIARQLPR